MEMPQAFERASLFQVRRDKAAGLVRSSQLLLRTIRILTPTPQVLPLIKGISFQPQPTTISALFPFAVIAILRRRQRKKKAERKEVREFGGWIVSLLWYHQQSLGIPESRNS